MEKFVKGDVVVISFPLSDLTRKRPALVLSSLGGDYLLLCQITSQSIKDEYSISMDDSDFEYGGLKQPCNLRPNRIFTIESNTVLYKLGIVNLEKLTEIIETIVEVLRK